MSLASLLRTFWALACKKRDSGGLPFAESRVTSSFRAVSRDLALQPLPGSNSELARLFCFSIP